MTGETGGPDGRDARDGDVSGSWGVECAWVECLRISWIGAPLDRNRGAEDAVGRTVRDDVIAWEWSALLRVYLISSDVNSIQALFSRSSPPQCYDVYHTLQCRDNGVICSHLFVF